MNTKFYPAISKSILNNYNPLDILSRVDDLFYMPTPRTNMSKSEYRDIPKANVYMHDSNYQIELAVPGFTRDEFNLNIVDGRLSVSVETSEGPDHKDKLFSSEWNYNSFSRSWTLPKNTNTESITARYEAGILYVNIPTVNDKNNKKVITVE